MKELWTTKWKKVLIWACGYLDFIAFALAGGYVIVKSERLLWLCNVQNHLDSDKHRSNSKNSYLRILHRMPVGRNPIKRIR